MALTGWLAGRYYAKDAKRLLSAADNMPAAIQISIARHLLAQIGRATDAESLGDGALKALVREMLVEATRERQMAVARGATAISDTHWCKAALVETWVGSYYGFLQRRISRKYFDRVDSAIFEFILAILPAKEILDGSGRTLSSPYDGAMTRDEVIARLTAHRSELEALGIERLRVFGSLARGEASDLSDVDLVAELDPHARIGFAFVGIKRRLEEILGCEVDLLRAPIRQPELHERIEREAVDAF